MDLTGRGYEDKTQTHTAPLTYLDLRFSNEIVDVALDVHGKVPMRELTRVVCVAIQAFSQHVTSHLGLMTTYER